MATVLLIEDDAQVRQLVARYLERAGLAAVGAATGEEGLQTLALRPVDLVLLDVSLPGGDGWSLLERIRDEWGERIAVIMLTARSDEPDRLLGLELGADDYIVKPFSPREVVARVKAVLRRAARAETVPERIELPGLFIDVAGRTVRRGDVAVALTSKEFDLLVELARHVNRVVPRAGLYEKVWGDEWEVESDHTLDVHISRLRRKLAGEDGFDYLTTVKGIGFKLEVTRRES
jgi:two-component system response regulator ResD